MNFIHPEILFFIWLAPFFLLVYWWGMRKRRKILSSYAVKRSRDVIVPEPAIRRRWTKAVFILLCVLFFIPALSGPRYGYRWVEVEKKGIDIFIALDCSRSMLADDVSPSRLERAKYEIIDLLNMLKGDRVGLVAFSGTAFLQCPLTHDYETFYLFLDSLTPDYMPVGGTNLADAINQSVSGFDPESNSDKAIILITDGESTDGNPIKAAENAFGQKIKIFCIGIGGKEGVPVQKKEGGFSKDVSGNIVMTKLDADTLKKISSITGGIYVKSVAGDMDLENIYSKRIRGEMESATTSSGRKKIWENRYQWFLGIAIFALMLEMGLPLINKRKAASAFLLMMLISASGWLPRAFAENAHDLVDQGISDYQGKDYEAALKSFVDAQLQAPDDDRINFNIGTAYYQSGDYQSALEHFTQTADSQNQEIKEKSIYNKGNSEFRLRQFKEAIESYETFLKAKPDDQRAAANLNLAKKMLEQQKQQQQQQQNADKNGQQNADKNGQQKKSGDTDQKKSESSKGSQKEKPDTGKQNPTGSQSRPDQSDKSEQSGQNDSKGNSKNSQDKNNNSPTSEQQSASRDKTQYGDTLDKQQMSPENTGSANDPKDSESQPVASGGTPDEQISAPASVKAGERVLDRLKDQPGGALIPQYMERSVNKDW